MRLILALLLVTSLFVLVPSAEAGRSCDRTNLHTVAHVAVCEKTYDDVPDEVDAAEHRYGTHLSVDAHEWGYSRGREVVVDASASSAYPLAPTVWATGNAKDRGDDGHVDLYYAKGGVHSAGTGATVQYVVIHGDRDGDGQPGQPQLWLHTSATGWVLITPGTVGGLVGIVDAIDPNTLPGPFDLIDEDDLPEEIVPGVERPPV